MTKAVDSKVSWLVPKFRRRSSSLRVNKFTLLEASTDLNLAPSNWLYPNPQLDRVFVKPVFSAFKMAAEFSKVLPEVDVVADSEVIKKLLKMPFNSEDQNVSMILHCIGGKSILIDDFDIKNYFRTFSTDKEEFEKWFKYVFVETLFQFIDREKAVGKKKSIKSLTAIKERNLESKFLYRSAILPKLGYRVSQEVQYDKNYLAITLKFA